MRTHCLITSFLILSVLSLFQHYEGISFQLPPSLIDPNFLLHMLQYLMVSSNLCVTQNPNWTCLISKQLLIIQRFISSVCYRKARTVFFFQFQLTPSCNITSEKHHSKTCNMKGSCYRKQNTVATLGETCWPKWLYFLVHKQDFVRSSKAECLSPGVWNNMQNCDMPCAMTKQTENVIPHYCCITIQVVLWHGSCFLAWHLVKVVLRPKSGSMSVMNYHENLKSIK
jgi:hypothetical protein